MTPRKKTAQKKTGKKSAKKAARKKTTPKKKVSRPSKLRNRLAKKKSAAKKAAPASSLNRQVGKRGRRLAAAPYLERGGSQSGEQSGDLQGLSRSEAADSESVDELLEEGNAFEADAVIGVEDAENADEGEVHTHEVPEDDVPSEYLDKD
ncbi:MAG TPA: hypothetical protein VMD99_04305 [Terriglobales bacterium]|nr:hypothetical protein [Terriglobales bacterium]